MTYTYVSLCLKGIICIFCPIIRSDSFYTAIMVYGLDGACKICMYQLEGSISLSISFPILAIQKFSLCLLLLNDVKVMSLLFCHVNGKWLA